MIRTEHRDGVRVLHMEFGSANALSPRVGEAIIAALEGNGPPSVLTGEGQIFSAGLNLIELAPFDRDQMTAFLERFSVLMARVLTTRFPLVAAVNGHAVAGGCVLAMACDQRVGTAGPYKIGMNEMAIGLTLPAIVIEILRGKLTAEHTRTVILGGALYTPTEALRVGLLDELADDAEKGLDRACEIARCLGRSQAAFSAMKGSLVAPITERLQQTREALDYRFIESWFGETATRMRAEAVARLQDKARP